MEAAHAHLLEYLDLLKEAARFLNRRSRPRRGVLRYSLVGIFEKSAVNLFRMVFGKQHIISSHNL
jgi:hypothetical protein